MKRKSCGRDIVLPFYKERECRGYIDTIIESNYSIKTTPLETRNNRFILMEKMNDIIQVNYTQVFNYENFLLNTNTIINPTDILGTHFQLFGYIERNALISQIPVPIDLEENDYEIVDNEYIWTFESRRKIIEERFTKYYQYNYTNFKIIKRKPEMKGLEDILIKLFLN